jgi:flagellar biosynthetic protein FlhB
MPDRDDKVFDPTPQRLEKAKEEGNVFKSQEILSVGLLTIGAVLIITGMPYAFDTLQNIMQHLYLNAAQMQLNSSSFQPLLLNIGLQLGFVLVPFFLALAIASAGLSIAQTGWNVTFKPLEPKPSRLNPLEGLKRIFSKKGLFNLFKSVVKIAVAGPLAYLVIKHRLPEILTLHMLPMPSIIDSTTGWVIALLAYILLALLLLSAMDFAFEKWKHKQDLKMTKQEVEDEQKRNEGDPQLKSRRRERAMEFAKQPRMDHAVMKSDVVVTNPTHYSVALSYDPDLSPAPRVMVKGIRKRALRIRELAAEFDVPIREEPPLARALYASVPEQEEIPEELYRAVAVILAEVYRKDSSYA